MLVKRVWELGQPWELCSDLGVEVRQSKSRGYWFLKHSLSQSAYCLLPLETLLSILHDLPSQYFSLWHAAFSAVAQGIVTTILWQQYIYIYVYLFIYLSFAPYLMGFYSFRSKLRICLSTIFCVAWSAVCTFKPFISSQFIENSIYYSFSLAGWYNCPKAKTWSVFAIQCIKTACESLLQGH